GDKTDNTNDFLVHKQSLEGTADSPAFPVNVGAGENQIIKWACNVGDYRVADLNLEINTTGNSVPIRVETYNNTEFIDILHSYYIESSAAEIFRVPVLAGQIDANEDGSCAVRISNLGENSIDVSDVTLDAYYDEVVAIRDIIISTNVNTTGLETTEELFNISVIIDNSVNTAYTINVDLNITNSSGFSVNTSTNTGINLGALSSINSDFLDINTSEWTAGSYNLEAVITGDFGIGNNRTETLIFEDIEIYANSENYMCSSTIEEFNAIIYHPFNEEIEYNISLEMPNGWAYSGEQLINISSIGNTTLTFNITSGTNEGNAEINATLNYNYPGITKEKTTNYTIEESASIPILEVVRETPQRIGSDRVFESSLTIYNKGCSAATSPIITESLSTGWTPANPDIKINEFGENIQLVSAVTDLEENIITWNLGQINPNEYAVLTYQIKSPTSVETSGEFSYGATWDGRTNNERSNFEVQTFDYEEESHLQFELEAVQQDAFPQPEVRSVQPNATYIYTLNVGNIGDINATGWNVTLNIPLGCNVTDVEQQGNYNSGIITWELPELGIRPSLTAFSDLNFTVSCIENGNYIFNATGIKDTRAQNSFSDTTNIGCSITSGNECSSTTQFTFSKPADPRYEKLNNVSMLVFYNWTDYKITIGEGYVKTQDDNGNEVIVWQNYSILDYDGVSGSVLANYILDEDEQDSFVNAARNIIVGAYVDATDSPKGEVKVKEINYTWDNGKLFEESQGFYTNVKVYTYEPLMQNATLYILGNELTAGNSSAERTGGWGETFNFSVKVRDRFSRNITIYAWHKKGISGDFEFIDNFLCESCDSGFQQINFTYDYNGTDIDLWEFKFNTTNPDGASSLSGFTYTIEKDDIDTDYILPDNEDFINRSDDIIFSVRSFDNDLGAYPNGSSEAVGKIYFSTIGVDTLFESSPTPIDADEGYFNRTVINTEWCEDAFFLGKHGWYGGTEGSDYVKNNLTIDNIGIRNFTLVGSLNNTIISPEESSSIVIGNSISFDGSVIDDCNVDSTGSATIVYNISNGDFSEVCTAGVGGDCQIATDVSFPVGNYNLTMTSSRAGHNNYTLFDEDRFLLRSVPLLKDARIDVNSEGWGVQRKFSVNVSDNSGDTVTVQLWQDLGNGYQLVGNDSCISCSNDVLEFNTSYVGANIGTGKTFKFNATDTEGNSDETTVGGGDYQSGSNTFTIEEDNVVVEYYFGNASSVNLLDSTLFVLRVYDSDNQTYDLLQPATVSFNVSKQGTGTSQTTIGTNTTNATGYAQFSFTPDETYSVGEQDWLGSVELQTYYKYNVSDIFKVTTLANAPQLTNLSVTPQTDGWGILREFNVTVRDLNNTADVNLYRASSPTSPSWILMENQTYTDVGNWETLNFIQAFSPDLIGAWYYMFNASNQVGNRIDTGQAVVDTDNYFDLNNEQVLLEYIAGNDSISNRSGSQTTLFSFRVQDQNGSYLANFPMRFHAQSTGTSFFTADEFVVLTDEAGYANFSFDASCVNDFAGAPKFLVGEQQWKVTVNESELSSFQQNDSSNILTTVTNVRGDIILDFSTPDGGQDFVQEQTITFLGATTDDCGDALVTSVVYTANSSENGFECPVTQPPIGANAFTCVYATTLATTRGDYNATILANATFHYDNQTSNTGDPGLFAITAKKKLENPTGNSSLGLGPSTAGWGKPNWNFSVVASSGDPDNILQVDLFTAQSVNPTTKCTDLDPVCVSETSIVCDNCDSIPISYLKNFTSDDIGTWYYQFKFNDTALTSTSGTDFSILLEKDETNITYGDLGNNSVPVVDSDSIDLAVRVFDIDRNSYDVTNPNATVTFKLLGGGYGGGEKTIGTSTTNSTGYAVFNFTPICDDGYVNGDQTWVGEILSSEPNYKPYTSDEFAINLDTSNCVAGIFIEGKLSPTEAFQNINFTVNTTLNAHGGNSENVNVTLITPNGWIVDNQSQEL
ncbi:MAG: hypothetical protein KJ760_20135, partial [Proteobacteria bacterium]|nr:hypothetical protein [Pseudomonadota bacterium]